MGSPSLIGMGGTRGTSTGAVCASGASSDLLDRRSLCTMSPLYPQTVPASLRTGPGPGIDPMPPGRAPAPFTAGRQGVGFWDRNGEGQPGGRCQESIFQVNPASVPFIDRKSVV